MVFQGHSKKAKTIKVLSGVYQLRRNNAVQWKLEVDKEKYPGCGECVDNCPGEIFELKNDNAPPTHTKEYHGWHTCESVCEEEAVKVNEAE